ncbi:MAG: urease accessory protein UreF [Sandaracinaceae bacterium]
MSAVFRLLQLASPTLPVGGFSYSRGLETAVERGWVVDEAGAQSWIAGLLASNTARLDAPLALRVHRAIARGDGGEVRRWVELTQATRETAELAAESEAMGGALARWMVGLALASREEVAPVRRCHLAAFALAALRLGLDEASTLRAFVWTQLEAATAAAVKLVPLGQTAGQRILLQTGSDLEALCRTAAQIQDDDIGALTLGLSLASAWHETQYSRLFRS